jgi:hypothetical protein
MANASTASASDQKQIYDGVMSYCNNLVNMIYSAIIFLGCLELAVSVLLFGNGVRKYYLSKKADREQFAVVSPGVVAITATTVQTKEVSY